LKKILLILIALLIANFQAYADNMLPANIITGKNGNFKAVLVEKNTNTLYLLQMKNGKPNIINKFTVLTGKNGGDKKKSGDKKTPEGIYFVTGFLSPEKLGDMYGSYSKTYGTGAFPLNYPNIFDRVYDKTGGGIWIHGVENNRKETSTKGCVAMQNNDLDYMKDYLKRGIPVVITGNLIKVSPEEYEKENEAHREFLNKYLNAWTGLDYETYSSYYHEKFKSRNGNRYKGYLASKKKLMKLYPYRRVITGNLTTFKENDKELVYAFDQFYCASNLISYGHKRLYFKKNDNKFKIFAEEFYPLRSSDLIIKETKKFLSEWESAWESLDIEKYMAFYGDRFKSGRMDYGDWKKDKTKKFKKYKKIDVEWSDISVSKKSPTRYSVKFIQRYKSGRYSDRGIKTITLAGCPGDFRIVSEKWRRIR